MKSTLQGRHMGMGSRNWFKSSKRPANEEMVLQITSMADIFTILLVFLLKSYAEGVVTISPGQGVTLPQAKGGDEMVEALKIEVSKDGVTIEGKPVIALKDHRFEAKDLRSGGSLALTKVFEQERKRQNEIAKYNKDVKIEGKVLLLADQDTPYTTLRTVLTAAALHGFTDYKLVVVKQE